MNKDNLFEAEEQELSKQINAVNSVAKEVYVEKEDMKQGSKAWFRARAGKFTGSKYPALMKKGKAKSDNWGLTAIAVVKQVYIERDLTDIGMRLYIDEMFGKNFRQTEWGNTYEPEARAVYIEKTGENVEETCFQTHPTIPYMGGSFDGNLITSNGIMEIKCPYDIVKHANNVELETIDEKHEYYGQIQGNIEIAGADFCDFVSYDPRRKSDNIKIIRVGRDDDYIARLLDRIHIAEAAIAYMVMGIDAYGAILLAEKDSNESKETTFVKELE